MHYCIYLLYGGDFVTFLLFSIISNRAMKKKIPLCFAGKEKNSKNNKSR